MYIISMPKYGTPDFIKVDMLLCRIDTCFPFWFIKSVIGVWTTDLFQKNPRLSRKQRFKVETCPNKETRNIVVELRRVLNCINKER